MAFENLIANAIKFTGKQKSASIHIGSKTNKKMVEFFVADNGVGFESTYADKLFQVFQRLHTEDEFPGTGIGLANVKRIIEKHGGSVRANSNGSKGATFYVALPR